MKKTYGLIVALALAAQACAEEGSDTGNNDPQQEAGELGSLSLKLTGVDTSGRDYRLRNASFTISSGFGFPFPFPFPFADASVGTSTVVSTETSPNAPVIAVELVPGSYNVSLSNPDWFLERAVNGVWERVDQAVLLSSATQFASVFEGGTTPVAFRFGVDGELIDFRSGELEIGIEIEQPGDQSIPDAGWPFPEGGFPLPEGGFPIFDASVPDATSQDAGPGRGNGR